MRPFRYSRASTPAEAVALATGDPNSAYVAGGTELLNVMKDGVQAPGLVIDINAVPLAGLEVTDGGMRIGALARMTDVARDPAVRERFPVLCQALLASASGQVRNMASVGGNLMQRTRCWYFRDATLPCNTRAPGSGCPAIGGENRWHAVLGGSEACIKVHPSDLAVALTALDATVLTLGPDGPRHIPIAEFYLLPGATPHLETALRPGELMVGVDIPATPMAARSSYAKVRDRASFEFALVSVAAALQVRGGTVTDARIVLGGVAPRPWLAREAREALLGGKLTEASLDAAADAAVRTAVPRAHNAFKIDLVRRVVRRALAELGGEQ
ncbi:MAG TPA: xanthine dehydrogenase family protein subunit M [Pseudonocardia sp.]|uniref:FAD binding domain-containing protein n=1 Tax=Pseudonocardia sp. TaxID=60912 RepID=UPI002CB81E51|nr:xanthine dehydrogenase family protein subunit M [Pseudonocardia sp.]HTF49121.1 xanthine dehydrogenase family protein subunit M [Pseudonocardia sp.]